MKWILRMAMVGLLGWMAFVPGDGGARAATVVTCDGPHRPVAALLELMASGDGASNIADPVPYVPVAGTPADAATIARVEATAQAVAACLNAGDVVGFLSLLSDGFLMRYGGDIAFSAEELAAPPKPLAPDERVSVLAVDDVIVRVDGRIDALVRFAQEDDRADPALTSVLTLLDAGLQLLIDDWKPVTLTSDATAWTIVAGNGYQGALVPRERVEEFIGFLSGDDVQGTWLPDEEQIAALEAALPGFLARSSQFGDSTHPLSEYGRQYAGFVAGGHAYILVNAFCNPSSFDWTHEAVFVMDGGNCFFQVTYEPATGAFTHLRVNGVA